MSSTEVRKHRKSLTAKLIVSFALFLVLAVVSVFIFMTVTVDKEPYEGTGTGRPTSLPSYTPVEITDPAYAAPTTGTGVKGPEVKEKEMDPAYFQPLFLPYEDEPNIKAGNGFDVKAEELKANEKFTAVAYPKGSSSSDPATITVGEGTVDSAGKLSFIVTTPTNLSTGSYILETKGPSKTFKTPFVIRP